MTCLFCDKGNAIYMYMYMYTTHILSLCVFIGDPTEKETEQITQLWQTSLFNANYEIQR